MTDNIQVNRYLELLEQEKEILANQNTNKALYLELLGYQSKLEKKLHWDNSQEYLTLIKSFIEEGSISTDEMAGYFISLWYRDLHKELPLPKSDIDFQIDMVQDAFENLLCELFFVIEDFDDEAEPDEECGENWFKETVLVVWNEYLDVLENNDHYFH